MKLRRINWVTLCILIIGNLSTLTHGLCDGNQDGVFEKDEDKANLRPQGGRITFSNSDRYGEIIVIDGWMPDESYTIELIHKGVSLAKTPIIGYGLYHHRSRILIEGSDASEELFTLRLYKTKCGSFEEAVRASANEPNLAFSMDDIPARTGPARSSARRQPGMLKGMSQRKWKSYGLTQFPENRYNKKRDNFQYISFSTDGFFSMPLHKFIPGIGYKIEMIHDGVVVAETPFVSLGHFNGPVVAIPGNDFMCSISLRIYHSRFTNWEEAVSVPLEKAENAFIIENLRVRTQPDRASAKNADWGLSDALERAIWTRIKNTENSDTTSDPQTTEDMSFGRLLFSNSFPADLVPLNLNGFLPGHKYQIELVHQGTILKRTDISGLGYFVGGIVNIPGLQDGPQPISLKLYHRNFKNFQDAVEKATMIPHTAFSLDDIEIMPNLKNVDSTNEYSTLDIEKYQESWKSYGEYDPTRFSSVSGDFLFSNTEPFPAPIILEGVEFSDEYVIELNYRSVVIARLPLTSDGFFRGSTITIPGTDAGIAEMNLHIYRKEHQNSRSALRAAESGNHPVYSLMNFMQMSDNEGNLKGIFPDISSALISKTDSWTMNESD